MSAPGEPSPADTVPIAGFRRALSAEVLLVLGVSLGASAIWALLRIVERLTRGQPLNEQTSALNESVTPDRPWLDLAYQLTGIGLGVVPALLALYLLGHVFAPSPSAPWHTVGLDARRRAFDLRLGLLLAAGIGLPGLALYLAARALGLNTQVSAANLAGAWWTVPVLLLAAVQNAVLEEVVVVGYLLTRLEQARWRAAWAVAASALVRGAYHLYQGFGGFVGNAVMGVVFALVWRRTRRVGPLVIAHTVLDVVAFLGYALLRDRVSWL